MQGGPDCADNSDGAGELARLGRLRGQGVYACACVYVCAAVIRVRQGEGQPCLKRAAVLWTCRGEQDRQGEGVGGGVGSGCTCISSMREY